MVKLVAQTEVPVSGASVLCILPPALLISIPIKTLGTDPRGDMGTDPRGDIENGAIRPFLERYR